VSRDTESGIVIEAFPELGHGGFGLNTLNLMVFLGLASAASPG
jgi:hypothetical protein